MLVLVWTGTRVQPVRSADGREATGPSGPTGHGKTGAQADSAERETFGSVPDGKPVNSESGFEFGSELKGEELLDESDPAVAVFTDSDSAHVLLRACAIGEVAGPSAIRARRLVACIGARGPPVG
jgi:hypothetical protein